MGHIPSKLRSKLALQPFYHVCARREALHDHECQPSPLNPRKLIEWEHALIYAGKQVQKEFAIIPLCWWAHSGPGLVKAINEWIALNRATDEEILELSHKGGRDYFRDKATLNRAYGVYNPEDNHVESTGINYGYPVEKKRLINS